jgi:hypothetical protein
MILIDTWIEMTARKTRSEQQQKAVSMHNCATFVVQFPQVGRTLLLGRRTEQMLQWASGNLNAICTSTVNVNHRVISEPEGLEGYKISPNASQGAVDERFTDLDGSASKLSMRSNSKVATAQGSDGGNGVGDSPSLTHVRYRSGSHSGVVHFSPTSSATIIFATTSALDMKSKNCRKTMQ